MSEEHPQGVPAEPQTDFGSQDYSASVPHIGDHSEGFLHNPSEIELLGYTLYNIIINVNMKPINLISS